MRKKIVLLASFAFLSNIYVAQDKWDTDGNFGIGSNAKFGSKNNKGFNIVTNNQTAVDVQSNGTFNFLKPVNFTNKVQFDSLRVLNYLVVDSIHARTIKIGNSWTVNDAGPLYGGTRPFNQQLQNATDRKHVFEGGPFYSASAVSRDSVQVAIGFINNVNGPRHKLQVHSNFAKSVFSGFTNQTTGFSSPNDGFRVGILSNGIAEVAQMENLDLRFLTNNNQRMVIKNTGRVGINTNAPGNRLTIQSAAGDPYFGGASSGLRFANLTSASPTIANTSNKVLSVDANGDVVLGK